MSVSVRRAGTVMMATALCAGALLVTATVAATPTSPATAKVVLGPGQYPAYPDITADGQSGFDAIWTGPAGVMTARLPAAGQAWLPAQSLGPYAGQPEPLIVSSDAGAAAAAWAVDPSTANGRDTITVRYRPGPTAAWDPAVTLRGGVGTPALGMDAADDAFVIWATDAGPLKLSERPAGAGGWTPPSTIPGAGPGGTPSFAVGPDGTLAVLTEGKAESAGRSQGPSPPYRSPLSLRVRPAGSSRWLPAVQLGTQGAYNLQDDIEFYQYSPRVTVDARGTVFASWQWPHRGGFTPRVAMLTRRDDWRRAGITALPLPGLEPVIAADAHDQSFVVWEGNFTRDAVVTATLNSRLRVTSVHAISRFPDAHPEVSADAQGTAMAGWPDGGALHPAGRGWCPTRVFGYGVGASVAVADDGTGVLLWQPTSRSDRPPVVAATFTACRH